MNKTRKLLLSGLVGAAAVLATTSASAFWGFGGHSTGAAGTTVEVMAGATVGVMAGATTGAAARGVGVAVIPVTAGAAVTRVTAAGATPATAAGAAATHITVVTVMHPTAARHLPEHHDHQQTGQAAPKADKSNRPPCRSRKRLRRAFRF